MLKKCRAIRLLDVASKFISVIIDSMNEMAFKIKKGCMDATFALKLALPPQKEFSLDTWVAVVDLVRAFDTVNQDMLMKFLSCYRIPDSLINIIKCLYQSVTIKFIWILSLSLKLYRVNQDKFKP